MKLSKKQLALIAIIINTVIWSASSPILKWSIGDTPPFAFAFFRFFFASLILLPFVFRSIKIKYEDIGKVFVLSLVGITLHISFYYLGLSLAPSINVPIITSSTPLFLIVGSIFFLHEKAKKKVIAGTVISFFGILIIVLRPFLDHGALGSIIGNLYHILGVFSFVIYTLLLKKYNLNYPFSTILFWLFCFGALVFFPLYLLEMETIPFFHITSQNIIGISYATICTSLIGYFCYNFAAKYITANEIGIFSYAEPFITAIVALPLLGEQITATYLIGSLFVFAGIIIAESRLHFHPGHNLKGHHR